MVAPAARYEVMLTKMLRVVQEHTHRLRVVDRRDKSGSTALHYAASAGTTESIKLILSLYPAPKSWFQTMCKCDNAGRGAWHCAAVSDNPETIKFMLGSLSMEQRVKAVAKPGGLRRTVLHFAVEARDPSASIDAILSVLPESQHLSVVSLQDRTGSTALHEAVHPDRPAAVRAILESIPASQRLQVVKMQDGDGRTVWHLASESTRDLIVSLLPTSSMSSDRKRLYSTSSTGAKTGEEPTVDIEQPVKRRRSLL